MKLKLYKNEHDRKHLRSECIEKPFIDSKIVAHQLRNSLLLDTIRGKNPVGLASNQVGLNSRVFVAKINNQWHDFINPRLVGNSDSTVRFREGCLSLNPNKEFKTKRYEWVKVSYENKEGDRVERKFKGFDAIIIQHELDHLNGLLCKDGGVNE